MYCSEKYPDPHMWGSLSMVVAILVINFGGRQLSIPMAQYIPRPVLEAFQKIFGFGLPAFGECLILGALEYLGIIIIRGYDVNENHLPSSDQFRLNGHRPSLWEAMLGMLVVGVFHAFLPTKLLIGPPWLFLAIDVVFLLPIVFTLLTERGFPYKMLHPLLLTLLGVLTFGLASNIALLLITVIGNKYATILLRAAILLWGSNVLIFGLWYWQIDGGGPVKRHRSGSQAADFLFPQQENGNPTGWIPGFLDYLFLAFTGATALSPTDMFPLTQRAKALMMIEALLSLLVVAVPAISEFHLPW